MKMMRFIFIGIFIFFSQILGAQDTIRQFTPKNLTYDKQGSPVILLGDTLFSIHAYYGSFTPAERARALSGRLMEVVREPEFYPDSLGTFSTDNTYSIIYRNRILVVIHPNDTIGTGLSQGEIADRIIKVLNDELAMKSVKFSFKATMKNIGYVLLVAVVLIMIIKTLTWLFRRINRYAERNKERLFKSIRINEYEFLTAEREYEVALYILKIFKIGLIILFFLVSLPVIFSIFPATEGITRRIIELVWSPVRNILLAVVNYIPELITIIIIYLIFKYLIRFIRFLSVEVENNVLVLPGFHPDWAKPTFNIIRIFLYGFMFVVIFPYLPGSDSPVFRGVSVFFGILISLGSTSLIGNIMAGLVITYMRPYKIGDRIKIDDIVGDVTEKTLMITRIRTTKNEEVTIPNAKVLTGYTVNYSAPTETDGLIIHTTITIGYDAPWRTVHQLMINAALRTEGVVKTPAPFVLQTSLDDFYVSYQVNAYIKNAQRIVKMKSDLHQHIQDEFNNAGVEIMSPHYRAERDGNTVTIPPEWDMEIPPMREKTSTGPGSPHKKERKAKPTE